jgi:hypothetical protein
MNSTVINRRIKAGLEDIDHWVQPEVLGMSDDVKNDFEKKKDALNQFLQGLSFSEIKENTGITRQHLHYLINRCTDKDEAGNSLGYFGLIKWKHSTKRVEQVSKLEAGKALPGSLQALFSKNPMLLKTMRTLILEGIAPESTKASQHLTWHQIHNIFLDQCTRIGIAPPLYPFCSDSKGKASLIAWGKKIISENNKGVLGGNQNSEDIRLPPSYCYERVEADGHFVDVNWTLEVQGLNGEGVIICRVSRLWLIALLECKSTAVIGYSISLGKNYNAADVTSAIRSSLVPWKPRKLSLSTISYKPEECLPNALMPELSYVCYDELWLDNAKSHLSGICLTMLERTVNAVPVFGPKESPNVRPRIEQLFDLLEEAGIHCLEGTTGSNPSDSRRSDTKDQRYHLKLETLLDLIDLLIVRYNTGIAPGTTISRNEVLKRAVQRETGIFRQVPIAKRDNCIKYSIFDEAVIGEERGRPVLRWKNARYYGAGLSLGGNLLGKKVLIMAQEDIREIEVVLIGDGTPLGKMLVERRWRNTPHSLFTRAAVRRFMTNNSFISHAADIPLAFRAHMEKEVKINATHQRVLARLQKEQERKEQNIDNLQITESIESDILNNAEKLKSVPIISDEDDYDELDDLISRLGTTYR